VLQLVEDSYGKRHGFSSRTLESDFGGRRKLNCWVTIWRSDEVAAARSHKFSSPHLRLLECEAINTRICIPCKDTAYLKPRSALACALRSATILSAETVGIVAWI